MYTAILIKQYQDLLYGIPVLEITAGQWTMSELIWALTGQPFVLPVMLTGHI